MTESSLTQIVQTTLRKAEFYVIKHADRFTVGVPDTTASKGGVTWWLEHKLIKLKSWPVGLSMSDHLSPEERGIQLATMVELQKKARATYCLFVATPGQWRLVLAPPDAVLHSIRLGSLIPTIETKLEDLPKVLEGR